MSKLNQLCGPPPTMLQPWAAESGFSGLRCHSLLRVRAFYLGFCQRLLAPGHYCTQELLHTPLWKPLAPRELIIIPSVKRECTEQEVLQPMCEAAQVPVHTLVRELRAAGICCLDCKPIFCPYQTGEEPMGALLSFPVLYRYCHLSHPQC